MAAALVGQEVSVTVELMLAEASEESAEMVAVILGGASSEVVKLGPLLLFSSP